MDLVTRTRRRKEKQLLALVLVVAGAVLLSFAFGYFFGRWNAPVSPPAPVPVPAAAPVAAPKTAPPAEKDFTFYDTLPKGEQAPLGSGINLPRETEPDAGAAPASQPAAAAAAPVAAAATQTAETAVEPAATAGKGEWMVQVASSKSADDARKMQERLAGKGFKASVREADLGERGKWYRVLVGPYPSSDEAGRAAGRLRQEGITGLVRKD